jgi:acetyl-CoA C-acetyltransferase
MTESIKDKVAIIGVGCSQFGERWESGIDDLIKEAVVEACGDAGLGVNDVQAMWVGTALGSQPAGIPTAIVVSQALQTQGIPVTRVENACASGQESVRGAAYAVASGAYDIVMAIGVDKMKDMGFGGLPGGAPGKFEPVYGAFGSGPGRYAMAATAYFSKYGIAFDEGKRILAEISVKSHYYGAMNPKAHLRRAVTVEDVMNAPMIAWPLGLFDCCGVTDGAAAVIMVPASQAKNYKKDYVTIKGIGLSAGNGWGKENIDYDFTYWDATRWAARQAYDQAGITDPRKDLDFLELHDCFSIAELIATESMFMCEPGGFKKEFTDTRAYYHDGAMPINCSGGLKSFGHPIGASGCRETYEICRQIQGKVERARQIKDARIGLSHNQGGHPGRFVCGVIIYGAP